MIENDHIYENGIREQQISETMYKGILADVQDNPQNYTEEAIDKIAKEYKWSDEKTQSVKDILKSSKEQYAKDVQDVIFGGLQKSVSDINTTYTGEVIREIAKEYGLSDEKTNALIDLLNATLNKQAELKKETAKAIIGENGGVLDSDTEGALRDIGYTDDDINSLKTDNQEEVAKNYEYKIDGFITSGDVDSLENTMEQLDYDYSQGNIGKEQYQKQWAKYHQCTINKVAKQANSEYGQINYLSEALKQLDDARSQGKLSDTTYKTLRNKAIKNGCILDGKVNRDEGKIKSGDLNLTIYGTDFDLDIDKDDYITSDMKVSILNEMATGNSVKTPRENTIIKVGNQLFIYTDWNGCKWFNVQDDGKKVSDVVGLWNQFRK